MTLLEEINKKCTPELVVSRNDVAIAAAVNAGRTRVAPRLGGIGAVLETLGPANGSAVLDALDAMRVTNSAIKWAWVLIDRGELDFGSPATRGMIDQLVASGSLPEAAAEALKALALVDDPVSVAAISDVLNEAEGRLTLEKL